MWINYNMRYWVLQPNMCFSLWWYTIVPPRHLNWYDLKYIESLSQDRSLISCTVWKENNTSMIWQITPQPVILARGGLHMRNWFSKKWQNNKMTITVMCMKPADNSKTGLWFVLTGMLRSKLFLYHPSISGLLGLFRLGEKLWWQVGQLKKQTREKGGKFVSFIFTQIKQCHDSFGYQTNASLKDKWAVSEIGKKKKFSLFPRLLFEGQN